MRTSSSPSSEELSSGKRCSAGTQALSSSATIVSFTPDLAISSLVRLRNASSSVMSASSLCVTCGIETQLRCSTGPLMRLMRDSATRSTSPNFSKSTFGQGRTSNPPTAAPFDGVAAAAGAPCALRRRLDVGLEDPALAPGPAHRREVDAQLAGQAPRAGPGVEDPSAVALRRGRCRRRRGRRRDLVGDRLGVLRGRLGEQLRGGRAVDAACGRDEDHAALRHAVADPDLELLDDALDRRGHVHRRLVGLERDERILERDRVAGRHVHLDDGDVLEVPDVGNLDLDHVGRHVRHGRGPGGRSRSRSGRWPP